MLHGVIPHNLHEDILFCFDQIGHWDAIYVARLYLYTPTPRPPASCAECQNVKWLRCRHQPWWRLLQRSCICTFFSWQLCRVVQHQVINRKMTEKQTSAMIRAAATSTDIRKRKIMDAVRTFYPVASLCCRLSCADPWITSRFSWHVNFGCVLDCVHYLTWTTLVPAVHPAALCGVGFISAYVSRIQWKSLYSSIWNQCGGQIWKSRSPDTGSSTAWLYCE